MENKLVVFKGKEIRRALHNNEWWFAVADVVEALTDSADPRQYIKKMRQRDSELNSYWGTICTPLRLKALDGKMRKTNCANTEGIFRIIQSIPSPKAEPFKRWLAKVGYERNRIGDLLLFYYITFVQNLLKIHLNYNLSTCVISDRSQPHPNL